MTTTDEGKCSLGNDLPWKEGEEGMSSPDFQSKQQPDKSESTAAGGDRCQGEGVSSNDFGKTSISDTRPLQDSVSASCLEQKEDALLLFNNQATEPPSIQVNSLAQIDLSEKLAAMNYQTSESPSVVSRRSADNSLDPPDLLRGPNVAAALPGARRIFPSGVREEEVDHSTDNMVEYTNIIVHYGVPAEDNDIVPTVPEEVDDVVLSGELVVPEDDDASDAGREALDTSMSVTAIKVSTIKRRRRTILIGLIMLAVAVCVIAVALGVSSKPSDAMSLPENFKLPLPIEKLARGLPDYTLALLKSELPTTSRTQNWYMDKLWRNSSKFQPKSPQGKAWKWLMSHPDLKTPALFEITERFALATLFYATDGPNWHNNSKWLSVTTHVCHWWSDAMVNPYSYHEVSYERMCLGDETFRPGFKDLLLPGNGLRGTIPPELGLISSLVGVRLHSNGLQGQIHPNVWLSWSNVRTLWLQMNSFSGSLPTSLGSWKQLGALYLDDNQFSGSLPWEIGRLIDLQTVSLPNNRLTGSIPSELTKLQELVYLDLSNNALTGSLPSGLGKLTRLSILGLGTNHLSGSIPSLLAAAERLLAVTFSNNSFTNTIPTQFGQLRSLQTLLLNNCSLTGPLPRQLGSMSSLRLLDVSDNQLSGTIPSELSKLSELAILRAFGTNLSGSIPQDLCVSTAARRSSDGLVVDCSRVACDCNCSCV